MFTPRHGHLLLAILGALVLSLSAQVARAGGSNASRALQIGVEVVHACAIDTNRAQASVAFGSAPRAALLRATQSALTTSCGQNETRVTLSDVRVSVPGPSATLPRLDVEF